MRHHLYQNTKLNPIFNPMKPVAGLPQPLVIDLDMDVCNYGKFHHPYTDQIRALLGQADAVVCDTPHLQSIIQRFTEAETLVAPFGFCSKDDMGNGGFVIGLLNHNDGFECENLGAWKLLLKKLDYSYLVFGDSFLDRESTQDFDEFAARIDVLLLPGKMAPINSIELPLAAMLAGTVVIAANTSSYYTLHGAPGVRMLDPTYDCTVWRNHLELLKRNPGSMWRLQQENRRYVEALNRQSIELISELESLLN